MDIAEITELKEGLTEFEMELKKEVQEDTDYQGEADALLLAISRLQSHFKNVNTTADFKKIEAAIAPDLQYVMEAAVSFSDLDEEEEDDLDLDELEFDDEDDMDLDDLEFSDEEDEE